MPRDFENHFKDNLPPDLTSFVLSPQASQLVAMTITSLKCGMADVLVKGDLITLGINSTFL